MPSLQKKTLSLYIRTGCQRQLLLNLYDDKERLLHGMPSRQTERAGSGYAGQLGYEWQAEKIGELDQVFGSQSVHAGPLQKNGRPGTIQLSQVLPWVTPFQFIVEAGYDPNVRVFREAIGFDVLTDFYGRNLDIGNAIPDLIQVLPNIAERPDWEVTQEEKKFSGLNLEVLPSGDTKTLSTDDHRLRLRVIDIKLAAEPGAHYFAEVVYYSISLSAWLLQNKFDDQFVVVAAPAVWPGSYEASAVTLEKARIEQERRQAEPKELALALQDDLEVAPFDVFAPRLKQFFRQELPTVLSTPWEDLPWHVSFKCSGCEFLGYPWTNNNPSKDDPSRCWPVAQSIGHLSLVAGMSKGNARQIGGIASDVIKLALLPSDNSVFDVSPTLRAKRTILPHRASSLQNGIAGIIPETGSDALMPRWPDLRIFVFLEYDLSSAMSAVFGIRAYWKEPLPFGSTQVAEKKSWPPGIDSKESFQEIFIVESRDKLLVREREEFLKFLRALKGILDNVRKQDGDAIASGRRSDPSRPNKISQRTYQIYLWDEAQRKHLARLVGRHLTAILSDQRIRDLAWLFPPPELLAIPEEMSYSSPFTLVSSVVQNTIAVPVPHHYTLLDVAAVYHPENYPVPSVHPLYREPLTDLVPGERIHEMWAHRGDWLSKANLLKETTHKKLIALAAVTARLTQELKPVLTKAAAPPLVRTPNQVSGLAPHSQLWYEYTKLNYALEELEEHTTRAMPAHEREARFKSAHLLYRIDDKEEREQAVRHLSASANEPLKNPDELVIYRISEKSREFNVRPPELGYAISPRTRQGFLNESAYALTRDTDIQIKAKGSASVGEAKLTCVSVAALDRPNLLIALRPWSDYSVIALEVAGKIDLSIDAMLDKFGSDFLTKKVRVTLQGIGRPSSAQNDPVALRALGISAPKGPVTVSECPASEFLWQTKILANTMLDRDTVSARNDLEAIGVDLNTSQWNAWKAALTRRITLIWGPPGTGKSQTLRAIVAGAVCAADRKGIPLRILIASQTYNAVDTVLLRAEELMAKVAPDKPYSIYRLQSDYNTPPAELAMHADIQPINVKTVQAPLDVVALQSLLDKPNGIVVVASTSQQIHNLAIATAARSRNETGARTQRRWFDLVIMDEASQLSIEESTLIISKAADGAAFVLAGDDLQLPPIQKATAPEGLDSVVGSVYGYVRTFQEIQPEPLQVNYRSCSELLEFSRKAGYDPELRAHFPDLRLALLENESFPCEKPSDWPEDLYWTSAWAKILDPRNPATCFVYTDDIASQSNDFEAAIVTGLLRLFFGRTDSQIEGEFDKNGVVLPPSGRPYNEKEFWGKAVGIVTPHRAQMANVVSRLQRVFTGHDPSLIWSAVDTVERFQGQQRDLIIASFGLGDPDLIEAEDEFLFNLNRFNVMASRARAKLIVLTTRSLVDHLANDPDVLEHSRLFKQYVDSFCGVSVPLSLGYIDQCGDLSEKHGELRTHV